MYVRRRRGYGWSKHLCRNTLTDDVMHVRTRVSKKMNDEDCVRAQFFDNLMEKKRKPEKFFFFSPASFTNRDERRMEKVTPEIGVRADWTHEASRRRGLLLLVWFLAKVCLILFFIRWLVRGQKRIFFLFLLRLSIFPRKSSSAANEAIVTRKTDGG